MNIFKFEFKSLYKQVIIWAFSLCSVFVLFAAMYPTYSKNEASVSKVFSSYPPDILKALGIDIKSIFSFNGFYSFILTYLLLTAVIMSVYFSLSVFGRERKNKTSDFLFTNPVTRSEIFFSKLFASFLAVLLINLIYLIVSLIMFNNFSNANAKLEDFLLITLSMFIVEAIFFSLGMFLSVYLKKIKNIGGIANSVGFMFFVISMVSSIIDEKWLYYVTPFKYFNPTYIMQHHALELKYVLLSIALIIGLGITTYFRYIKRDVESV